MLADLKAIARKTFNGDTRRGPRHELILRLLGKYGCETEVDERRNIWVYRGAGNPLRLFSSHMDVDPRIRRVEYALRKGNRRVARGIMDNSAGCCLNLQLARRMPRKGTSIHVFTASEEVDRINPRLFARSAREIVKKLRKSGAKPSMCVAIDVTYPRLLMDQRKVDWSREYEDIFDTRDRTHCYLDGFNRRRDKELGVRLVKAFGDPRVVARNLHGHDEAFVYERLAPSFAFGPVVFGHFDRPNQEMPLSHMETALRFLKTI